MRSTDLLGILRFKTQGLDDKGMWTTVGFLHRSGEDYRGNAFEDLRNPTTGKASDAPMMPAMAPPRIPATKRPSLPWLIATKRRSGRPAASEDADQRARHIECAGMMLLTNWPTRRIAASLGISRRTAYYWFKLALSYEGAKSEALRQLAAKKRLNSKG
jgi:hypothetical protein